MRIMAIDYGKKRVGIAMTDPMGVISQPLITINTGSQHTLVQRIVTLINENNVGLVLIGNPLSHKGQPTAMSSEIGNFIKLLKKKKDIKIIPWDERFTSQYASKMLKDLGIKKKQGTIDKIAAAIMLDEFLRSKSISTV
jgi:putative Holliday junction resolvase